MTTKKKTKTAWWKKLDDAEIREAMEEATVDCYDESEQIIGLMTMVQQEVEFPFLAIVMGEEREIVEMRCPEHDSQGMDLVCKRNGEKYCVAARHVELIDPLPEGHLYLAAYLDWKSRF